MKKEKRVRVSGDKAILGIIFLFILTGIFITATIYSIKDKDYILASLSALLSAFLLFVLIGSIPLISTTFIFKKEKIIVCPFIGRKIDYRYDEFSSVATVEIVNKKGTITSRWLALIKENQEYSSWNELTLGGRITRQRYFSVKYSKGMEKILYSYFENRKRIRASKETGVVLSILDLSDHVGKEKPTEEKVKYTIVADATYDEIRFKRARTIFMIFIVIIFICIIALIVTSSTDYRFVAPAVVGGACGSSTLSSSISHVYKVEGKDILCFSSIQYKNAAFGDAPLLDIHWVDSINVDEVDKVELCELTKEEVKKLVKGPKGSMKYLKITLKDGRVNGISVANYSLRQIHKVTDEINLLLEKSMASEVESKKDKEL